MPSNPTVICIPGFGGTALAYKGGILGKTRLWYNPTVLALNPTNAMRLSSNGATPFPDGGRTLFPDGYAAVPSLQNFTTALVNKGYNVDTFLYDWRKDLNAAATAFVNYLADTAATGTFDVVTQSMGGLVAQLAYPLFRARGLASTWRRTVYLNCPHGGSYWAIGALCGFFGTGSEQRLYAADMGYRVINALLSTPEVPVISKQVAAVIASWPSVYQCLPSFLGPWANLDPALPTAISAANLDPYNPAIDNNWLTLADTTRAQLVTLLTQPRPDEVSVYGTAQQTPVAINSGAALEKLGGYRFSDEGDGTVPQNRAVLPAGKSVKSWLSHLDMMVSIDAIEEVERLLSLPTVGSDTISQASLKPTIILEPPAPSTIPIPPLFPFINTHGDP